MSDDRRRDRKRRKRKKHKKLRQQKKQEPRRQEQQPGTSGPAVAVCLHDAAVPVTPWPRRGGVGGPAGREGRGHGAGPRDG